MQLTPPATRADASRFIAPFIDGLYQLHVGMGGSSASFTNALEALRFKLLPQGPRRPSELFAKLAARIDEADPKSREMIVGRLSTAYEDLIAKREDQLWTEPIAEGGLLLHLPEMAVAFGTAPGNSPAGAHGARLTIPSATPLQQDDVDQLGRISYQAELDGEAYSLVDRIGLGALTFVRVDDYTLDLYRNGRRAASVTTFDEFAQRISRSPSADAFIRSWQHYLGKLLPLLQEISTALDQALQASWASMPGDDEEIPFPLSMALRGALERAPLMMKARLAFSRNIISDSWEHSFVGESLAQINNAISGITTFSYELMRCDAQNALTMLQSPFKPFIYLIRSHSIVEDLWRFVKIDLDPEAPMELLPANALPVRQALDHVLYEAGVRRGDDDGAHRVLVSFDPAASRLVITDRSEEGRSAFTAFEPVSGVRQELRKLEPQIGGVIEYLPPVQAAAAAPGAATIGRITIPVQLAAGVMAGAVALRPLPVY